MAKVLSFSQRFPAKHPKAKEPTFFVEKLLTGLGIEYTSENYFQDLLRLNEGVDPIELREFFLSLDSSEFPKKIHTIREGSSHYAGEMLSPRIWLNRPYHRPQIVLCDNLKVKAVQSIYLHKNASCYIDTNKPHGRKFPFFIGGGTVCETLGSENLLMLSQNDGLSVIDFLNWFKFPSDFQGQIIHFTDYLY